MNKDQFWQIIDSVNQASVNKDRESHACIASEILSRYSLEDILDWHLIFGEYSSAAYRYDLWVASATIGAHYTDDGFIDFRSWLISHGKEIYMNALRDPNSLAAVPLNGEEPNFERFGYVAYHAYEAKLFRIDPDRPEDLFKALCTHPMDPQTKAEIQSELPQRPDISMEEFNRLIAKVSRRASKKRAPKTISELLNTLNVAFGYVYEGNQRTEYVFYNTPENIANFIGRWPGAAKIIVTDTLDRLIVNTIGNFIDMCPDQDLLQEIKETLIPIQMGEAEVQPFFCPTRDEVDEYCRQSENENL